MDFLNNLMGGGMAGGGGASGGGGHSGDGRKEDDGRKIGSALDPPRAGDRLPRGAAPSEPVGVAGAPGAPG